MVGPTSTDRFTESGRPGGLVPRQTLVRVFSRGTARRGSRFDIVVCKLKMISGKPLVRSSKADQDQLRPGPPEQELARL
jgi:hypothetical protein